VYGSLDSVTTESIPELIFYLAQPGIQKCGICQDKLEVHSPKLIEAVLVAHEILREILHNLKQMLSSFTILEKL
jgi:hypothetical protein